MNFVEMKELETARLKLRRLRFEDLYDYYEHITSDGDVTRYLELEPHQEISETMAELQNILERYEEPGFYRWAISSRAAANAVTDCLKAMRTSDLLTLAKLGMEAITRAQAVYDALGDPTALQGVLNALEGKPLSLKALAVSGSDLKPLFEQQNRPLREMGGVLESLWLKVLTGELPNERAALLDAL